MVTFKKARPTSILRSQSLSESAIALPSVKQHAQVQQILHASGAQAKLRVSQPDDVFEQEADRVADRIMGSQDSAEINESTMGHEKVVQRRCEECEEEEQVQLKRQPGGTMSGEGISSASNPLPQIRRLGHESMSSRDVQFFSSKLNRDMSDVKIHHGHEASMLAKQFNARAFTLGNHVVFGENQYQPQTTEGKRLIAHELVHVVQQNGSPGEIQREPPVSGEGTSDVALTDDQKRWKIQELRNEVDRLYKTVDINGHHWMAFFRNVNTAYALAVSKHKQVIDAQNQVNAERAAIIMAAMSAISMGALAYGSTLLQAGTTLQGLALLKRLTEVKRDAVVNATEDIVQTGVDKVLTTNVSSAREQSAGQDPLIYLNEVLGDTDIAIASSKQSILDMLESIDLSNSPENYDALVGEINTAIAEIRKLPMLSKPPVINQDRLRVSFEKYIWADWILRTRTDIVMIEKSEFLGCVPSGAAGRRCAWRTWEEPKTVYVPTGGEVEARFSDPEIGITEDSGVGDFGWDGHYGWLTTPTEVKQLIEWAKAYQSSPDVVIPEL